MKKWLREPLLHFLLIGGAIFFLYGLLNNEVAVDDGSHIVITEADVDHLITLWEQKWQRLPTQVELEGLVEAQIREEVLYREAMAMGLDQDDTIVRRRLAQKVEFISSELTSPAEPTELWITSPYFVPDDIIVRALQTASIRGVDVRILIPAKADQYFVELASLTYYDDMKNSASRSIGVRKNSFIRRY